MNKSRGVGKSKKCHKLWSNAFFAKEGLFAMKEAKEEEESIKRQDLFASFTPTYSSEPVSPQTSSTGEPNAGEPPVRFGGRGGETLPYPYLSTPH
jgi:hypothetical protein